VLSRGRENSYSLPELQKINLLTGFLVGTIIFILIATFAAAILYPPNNWDSMTYHMARVANWISNKSVSFYPTAITRQNYQMPLAEFAIMHLQILTGCDLYANLVQWMSFLVLILLGFLIAGEFGLTNRQQLISAIIIATLPMAILQASSTQNDLVVSSFLMCFCLFMVRLRVALSAENLLFAAISFGLALFTKGTAFVYSAAIGISLSIPVLMKGMHDRNRLFKAATALFLIVLLGLLLNLGHFWRNFLLYGHPLSTEAEKYRNEEISAGILLSNIMRNGALHIGTPSTRINWYQYRALQLVLGSQLNNPKTTFYGKLKISHTRHEDTAGNLIHIYIAIIGVFVLPITFFWGRHNRLIWYAIGVALGTVLYCAILKWQPWASRLHMPLFALAAPLFAITITSDIIRVNRRIGFLIILCMVLYSLPYALANQTRSLVTLEWNDNDRMKLYFAARKRLFNDYNAVMNVLKDEDIKEVGLYLGYNDYEYPFWAFAKRENNNMRNMIFRHVGVSNLSSTINEDLSLPQYVIATKSIKTWENAPMYAPFYLSDHLSVFMKSEQKGVLGDP
jgi:hypothetical protein